MKNKMKGKDHQENHQTNIRIALLRTIIIITNISVSIRQSN